MFLHFYCNFLETNPTIIKNWQEEQYLRKADLKAECENLELNVTRSFHKHIVLDNFIIDKRHKLLYCFTPKVNRKIIKTKQVVWFQFYIFIGSLY